MTTLAFLRIAMLLLGLAAAWQASAAAAPGGRTVNSVVMTYGAQVNVTTVSVPPAATIATNVTVTRTGGGGASRWGSTSWLIGTGVRTCVDHADVSGAGTSSLGFNMTAPVVPGTYNAQFVAYQDNICATGASATFTLTNAVIVLGADNSTVTADPTTVAADGVSTATVTVALRDGSGNPLVGKTVSLTALSGSSTISPPSGPSNASGVVTFTVRDSVVEPVTYRARNTTDAITLAQTATVTFISPALVVSFNVVQPGADPVNGRIFTKIAGATFSLDIVALRGGALEPKFTGTVAVEVVDNAGGGACSSLPVIMPYADQTFTSGNKGRRSVSGAVGDVYRNARVRVKYPAVAPTIISCSGDNFAVRPDRLAFTVSHTNRTTPGAGNFLSNTSIPGGEVHNAGRPFTISATAWSGAAKPAITTRYDGTPTAVASPCGGSGCTTTLGNLALGAWAASAGTVTTTATYDDVGAFTLQLEDATYAAVDAADTPLIDRAVPPTTAGVGRFVPERFTLTATSIVPRAAIAACAGSSFTYMGERMDAVFTLTAVKFPSGTTARYAGALAPLVLTDPASFTWGAIDGAAPTPLTARVATSPAPLGTTGTWTAGVATVTARVAIQRPVAGRDGPYTNVRLGIAPSDPDGVTLDAATLNLDADASGTPERAQIGPSTELRFGRLRLQNAHGSQLTAMAIPVQVQYWNGTAFVINSADSCTPLTAANVALGNYQKNLQAGETTLTVPTPIGTNTGGVGALRLSAPGAANNGSVDVSVNLTSAPAGFSCSAGMGASTPTGMSYLHGAWCGAAFDRDPVARVTFGVFRNSDRVIYQRENY